MKLDWQQFIGQTVNITMNENYGVVYGVKIEDQPVFYEIVFKTGKLIGCFDEGLLLESVRDEQMMKIYVPYTSIKCVEIF
ncbi:MAG: hypothetical protein KJ799_00240 [Bacteroidetes bacterium]|nr:hypothetical protein [Bacteroidota bacterium]MBU1680760.1 hypothetical protein [Bacteroidota bacterium]MBU2505152.1 hypothetical protein [Bacteroidota bacterium]